MREAVAVKISQEPRKFQPVTITLETTKEVQLLGAALAKVSGNAVDEGLIYEIYRKMIEMANYQGFYKARITTLGVSLEEDDES